MLNSRLNSLRNSLKVIVPFLFSAVLSFAQLQGIVDIHTHADPDSAPRKIDVLELARLGKAAGMRAIVLKNHNAPTVQAAYLVRQMVPGIEIFGAIALNRSVGGLNTAAIEQAAAFKGNLLRIVWMPTFDSENNIRVMKENRVGVSVAHNGKLLPEVDDVLKAIAKAGVALGTGHSAPEEDLMLVREAKKLGITKIVVTHPLFFTVNMNMAQMQEAANLGAFLELCGNSVLPTAPSPNILKLDDYVKAIRTIGPEHFILSSDLGQPANPVHTEGWKIYLDLLRKAGIKDSEIDLMARKNPAKLLGLE